MPFFQIFGPSKKGFAIVGCGGVLENETSPGEFTNTFPGVVFELISKNVPENNPEMTSRRFCTKKYELIGGGNQKCKFITDRFWIFLLKEFFQKKFF